MTFEELQKCLVSGVTIEFDLQYPDGHTRSSQSNYDMLLKKMALLEIELEAARKAAEFNRTSLKNLRTELNNAVGYVELGRRHDSQAPQYLEKMQPVLTDMGTTIAHALGEPVNEEADAEDPANRQRAADVGMDDFLAKPVNSARLLKSLARFR